MKTKKSTLITIIVLLVIVLPPAVYGTYASHRGEVEEKNVNKDFYFNGYLYFYDESGKEKGRYECVSTDCGYVETVIDDEEYNINYYKDGQDEKLAYSNDDFALIQDNKEIFIYSLKLNQKIVTFKAVKDYHTKINGDALIAQNEEGKWGVLLLSNMTTIIPYNYDFIGLVNNLVDDKLDLSTLIAKDANGWYLIDGNNVKKTTNMSEVIVNYTDKYLLTNKKELYDYTGSLLSLPVPYQDIYLVDNYVVLVNNNVVLVYDDIRKASIGMDTIGSYENISFTVADKTLNIYLDGIIGSSIELNS